MPFLIVLLELLVGTLAVWVAVLNLGLYGRLPIATLEILFPVVWLLFLVPMTRPWLRRLRAVSRAERVFARNTLVLGCLVGLLVLVASRPDADDVGFMHPMLVEALSPEEPFTVDPFRFRLQGKKIEVPFFNENEAYEAMVIVVAGALGAEPLQLYHNVFAFFAAIAWVLTYALLFRHFRVPRDRVVLAVLATVAFLLVDGNLHQSFGNFSLVRIWQGKVIAFAVLVPAFLLFVLRFLARPSAYRCALVLAIAAASIFINRSTIFALAVLGTALALAYSISYAGDRRRRTRAIVLVGLILFLWAIGLYIVVTSLSDDGGWSALLFPRATTTGAEIGPVWWQELYASMHGSPAVLARDILFLLVLPWLALRRPLARFLPILSLVIAALAFFPLTGPIWHQLLDQVYWRLYHALPLPLCAGLLVCLFRPSGGRRRILGPALAALMVLVTVLAIERPVLSAANAVELKRPFEYRFRERPLAFARSVTPRLYGRYVLAPDEIANILALTEHDTIELAFVRAGFTWGAISTRADWAVTRCQVTDQTGIAVRRLLHHGVEAVIMARCDDATMRRLHALIGDFRLVEVPEAGNRGYRLYRVEKTTRSPAPGTSASFLPPPPIRSESRSWSRPGRSAQPQLSRRG